MTTFLEYEPVALRCLNAGVLERAFVLVIRRARGHNLQCRPFGSSVRRITSVVSKVYAGAVILLEIGLTVAVVVFFVAIDLYVRGCEKI
jgi:hypothetical protein